MAYAGSKRAPRIKDKIADIARIYWAQTLQKEEEEEETSPQEREEEERIQVATTR